MKPFYFILSTFLICCNYIHAQSDMDTTKIALSPPYHIEVYTMPFCGHCKAVSSRLKEYDLQYDSKNIFLSKKSHEEMLKRTFGHDGVPRIFINNHYIGGRHDFDHINNATLEKIVNHEPCEIKVQTSMAKKSF